MIKNLYRIKIEEHKKVNDIKNIKYKNNDYK